MKGPHQGLIIGIILSILSTDALLAVRDLATQCGARITRGQFRIHDLEGTKPTRPGRRPEDLGQNRTLKLAAAFGPICKFETRRRSNATSLLLHHDLRTTADAFRPDLLAMFCGHELCPTESDERDFGCSQVKRCLCYLRRTQQLPLPKRESRSSRAELVHTLWVGDPMTTVPLRLVDSFLNTHDQAGGVTLIVWFLTTSAADGDQLKRRIEQENGAPVRNTFDCALLEKTASTSKASASVQVCTLTLKMLAYIAAGTPFEGKTPVTRGRSEQVLKYPRSLSDYVRFVLLAKFGGLYLDVDSIFLRSVRPLFGLPFFSSWWGVQSHLNTGAVLRMVPYDAASFRTNPSSRLYDALVAAARPKNTSSTKKGPGNFSAHLVVPFFHPAKVTKIAAQLGFMRSGEDLVPLTLAFFEPAWCQPRNAIDEFPMIPSVQELHQILNENKNGATPHSSPLTQMIKTAERQRMVQESGAFALHYHRASESDTLVSEPTKTKKQRRGNTQRKVGSMAGWDS